MFLYIVLWCSIFIALQKLCINVNVWILLHICLYKYIFVRNRRKKNEGNRKQTTVRASVRCYIVNEIVKETWLLLLHFIIIAIIFCLISFDFIDTYLGCILKCGSTLVGTVLVVVLFLKDLFAHFFCLERFFIPFCLDVSNNTKAPCWIAFQICWNLFDLIYWDISYILCDSNIWPGGVSCGGWNRSSDIWRIISKCD